MNLTATVVKEALETVRFLEDVLKVGGIVRKLTRRMLKFVETSTL